MHDDPRVAILTPDPDDHSFAGLWPAVLAGLQSALDRAGVDCVPTPWTTHADDAASLARHALVLPLLAWGYHLQHPRWLRACATWQAAGVRMGNAAQVLAWNSDKRYLAELERRGVPIPPTTWGDNVTAHDIVGAFEATAAPGLIVKPTVSGGAWKTVRLRAGEAIDGLPDGAVMIQPYLPAIESAGETSALYFGGRLGHVVNKRPTPGEFRIQTQYGGRYTPVAAPAPEALALAEQVLAAIDAPLLYARIDMVPDGDGRWLLMEAELIEPDLYLGVGAGAAAAFAQAVQRRLAG